MMAAASREVGSAVCLGCGCTCDDITLTVESGRITGARAACPLGVSWFGDGQAPARARVAQREVSRERALDEASRVLGGATRPVVYLAPGLSCEAQRHGVAIADALRAAIDHPTSLSGVEALLASQERGRVGATLGEVANRADLLIYWGVDPETAYPRFRERYAPMTVRNAEGSSRPSRTTVAVDIDADRGPADAATRLTVDPAWEGVVLEAVRARAGGVPPPESDASPWVAASSALFELLTRASSAVFVAEAGGVPAERVRGLLALTQAANAMIRCSLTLLRQGGNIAGAEACLTSQTGYPVAVDFGRGYPRYRPRDGRAADLIARGEVDAVLVLGAVEMLSDEMLARLGTVGKRVIIGPRASDGLLASSHVVIDTGRVGVHESGLVYRMDDVPLTARSILAGPPSATALIDALRVRVVSDRP